MSVLQARLNCSILRPACSSASTYSHLTYANSPQWHLYQAVRVQNSKGAEGKGATEFAKQASTFRDTHEAAGGRGSARNRWSSFIITIDGLVATHIASFHFATLTLVENNERQIHSPAAHCNPRHLEEPHQHDNVFCGYQAILEGRGLILACPRARDQDEW